MSISRINPDDIETLTLKTNPPRTFISSSTNGIVSGNLYIFPRRSSIEKEVHPLSIYSGSLYSDQDIDVIRNAILLTTSSNKQALVSTYMNVVNAQQQSLRKQQTVQILRFVPSAQLSSDTLRKSAVINNLMPYYRVTSPESHFAFTNYNSLNFFTGSSPSDTAIIYPDESGLYDISGAFTFDFWINPRYSNDFEGAAFKAGTIFHRSSSFAVSLISGSSRDLNGKVDGYRLVLQLSHSANVNPSSASQGSFPNDLIFFSDDNALRRNTWHHCSIRWGTNQYNNGSGSFLVNGTTLGTFVIPSSSLGTITGSSCLFVGNFFTGQQPQRFFSTDVSTREGFPELYVGSGQTPVSYSLTHGLHAEVQELKIYGRYLDDDEVEFLETKAPLSGSSLLHDELLFYLPPFFTKESTYRQDYGGFGGVLATPFFEKDGTTTTPINIDVSFGGFGHYINLENFVRDFAQGQYGRLFNLTASVNPTTAPTPTTFNDYLYSTGSNIKRNMMLLPSDNGNFYPNFTFMIPTRDDYILRETANSVTYYSGTLTKPFRAPWKVDPSQFVNDLGNISPGFVTLRNLLPSSSFQKQAQGISTSSSLNRALDGVSPEFLSDPPSNSGRYTVFQRTGDNSSNQVVFFDISNLYYGLKIHPGSVVLKDTSFTGSSGKIEMILRDDGLGNIYRASASGSAPTWASVGNVFYNEGIILLKHPSMYFFGKDQFELTFQGEQNTHILTYNLFKRPLSVLSSSNPNYMPVSASDAANDTDQRFVYITGINIHDDNLNVIMKTSLAQPVLARTSEKFLFKVKMDW